MLLSPLIRFGTSTWTYEGWQGQVYKKQYAKSVFARECLGEYCQYQYNNEPLFKNGRKRFDVLQTSHDQPTPTVSESDFGRLRDVVQGVGRARLDGPL